MRLHRAGRLLAFLFLLPLMRCSCGSPCSDLADNQPDHPGICGSSSECGDHYACNPNPDDPSNMCCQFIARACSTEADCCPGQTCSPDKKKCFDQILECTSDADCGDTQDRFCESYSDHYGTTQRCRYHACGEGGSCPDGQSCFDGVCTATLPCGGTCAAGTACVVETGKCQANACAVSCQTGFIAAFSDQTNVWDACDMPAVECTCTELPPIQSNDLGRHSAIAADSSHQQLVVSSYDGQYGDLTVSRYDGTGALAKRDWVDGIPASGTVKWAPSGPRGGIVEPGDDVGRFTDVAVSPQGLTYVSYYDATHGDLKLAYQTSGGSWSKVTVDGADADLGKYTSIAVDANGLPGIAYFQSGGSDSFDPTTCPGGNPGGPKAYVTALKLAKATSPTPGATDFTVQTLACMARPVPPCSDCTDTCADPGAGPACYAASTACSPACDQTTEACVDVSGTPTCAKKYNPSKVGGLTDGVGMFTSIAFQGTDAWIVYMKRSNAQGSLYGIKAYANGTASAPYLLDGSGDTGYSPDLQVASFGLVVSWQDLAHHSLKFYYGSSLSGGTVEVVDDGVGSGGGGDLSIVGGDSALAFGRNGDVLVAYQNSTRGDLELSRRTAGWSRLPALRTDGSVGYFADAAVLGSQLFVSHARLHARDINGVPQVDNQLLLDHAALP
jgi:hypothetical protein